MPESGNDTEARSLSSPPGERSLPLELFAEAALLIDASDLRVVAANRRATTLFRRALRQLTSCLVTELALDAGAAVALRNAIATGRGRFASAPARSDSASLEIDVLATPVNAGAGAEILLICRDVTFVQCSAGNASCGASEWQATADAVDAVVVMVDAAGRISRANQKAVELAALQTAAPLGGAPLRMLAGTQPWLQADELARSVRGTSAVRSLQVGDPVSQKTWELSAGCVRTADGDCSVVVAAKDISNYVSLEFSARSNERVADMGRLVGNVAHEARSPLFAISATIDAMESRLGKGEPGVQRYVDNLRTAVGRLTSLMNDLLDYGKPPVLEPRVERLADIVADAIAAISSNALQKRITVTSLLGADDAVLADRARLAQAVQNVIANAIDHAGAGSTVKIRASRAERDGRRWVACSIEDEGPGFNPQSITRVFEPFYTTRAGGTGLGLSIVQRIVDMHGGSVVASNIAGGGACVTIHLPLHEVAG